MIKTITPNQIERLIYYVNEGSLKVTSLKFIFHTLPIDKLETSGNEKIIIKHLIISTDPNSTIAFNAGEDEFIDEYYVYYEKNTFIWLITDKDILCMLKSNNLTYYNSNENENNEETIERKTVYSSSGEHVTDGKSKFCQLNDFYAIIDLRPAYNVIYDYYTNYNGYFDLQELKSTTIMKKGSYRLNDYLNIRNLKDGLSFLDFSIPYKAGFKLKKIL